jgi:hypothetical protein
MRVVRGPRHRAGLRGEYAGGCLWRLPSRRRPCNTFIGAHVVVRVGWQKWSSPVARAGPYTSSSATAAGMPRGLASRSQCRREKTPCPSVSTPTSFQWHASPGLESRPWGWKRSSRSWACCRTRQGARRRGQPLRFQAVQPASSPGGARIKGSGQNRELLYAKCSMAGQDRYGVFPEGEGMSHQPVANRSRPRDETIVAGLLIRRKQHTSRGMNRIAPMNAAINVISRNLSVSGWRL